MSKPLTGTLTHNKSADTWTASLPVATGASNRKSCTFPTKVEAAAWLENAIADVKAGRPIAEPAKRSRRSATAMAGTSFKSYADKWVAEQYVEDRHADVSRQEAVERFVNVVDRYFTARGLYLETAGRTEVREMYHYLLKSPAEASERPLPDGVDPAGLYTTTEALSLLADHGRQVSRSTFKRARQDGLLTPIDCSSRPHLYRAAEIFQISRSAPSAGDEVDRGRYGHSTLSDLRWAFREVLAFAKEDNVEVLPGASQAKLPKDLSPQQKPHRALTLEEGARIAARLHVVHQLVFWLLMAMGLRIGEAFGLLVEDVLDAGPGQPGFLTVQAQGGQKFKRRQADGSVIKVDHVDVPKGGQWRVLAVPEPLMVLLRVVIRVFHTTADGEVQMKARLVPGLKKANAGGQSAFRRALCRAGAAERLDVVTDGTRRGAELSKLIRVTPSPHHLRKSFATVLHAAEEQIEDIRAALGHRRGGEVIHLHYLLNDPRMAGARRIAETTASQIADAVPSGLMVPTTVSCTTGSQAALARDGDRIDGALADADWFVGGQGNADGLVTVGDAAAMRGVTDAHIRAGIAAGRLSSTPVACADGVATRHMVDVDDVIDEIRRVGNGSAMRALAEELGLPYDTVRQYIKRHPAFEYDAGPGRDDRVPEHIIEHTRTYFLEQRELEERAVRMPAVATELGMSVPGIETLIKRGLLVEDVRFHGGVRSITKVSIDRYRAMGGRRKRRY